MNLRKWIFLILLCVASISPASAMDTQVTVTDRTVSLHLAGRFDFKAHREFREAVDAALAQAANRGIVVDLRFVTYMDDSALGMLLMFRDKAKARSKEVAIHLGSNRQAQEMLEMANLIKLFAIQ